MAVVKCYMGRGEQRIHMMKIDRTFSVNAMLLLLEQQEYVLWWYCLQEMPSEINGKLFQTPVSPVSGFKS